MGGIGQQRKRSFMRETSLSTTKEIIENVTAEECGASFACPTLFGGYPCLAADDLASSGAQANRDAGTDRRREPGRPALGARGERLAGGTAVYLRPYRVLPGAGSGPGVCAG